MYMYLLFLRYLVVGSFIVERTYIGKVLLLLFQESEMFLSQLEEERARTIKVQVTLVFFAQTVHCCMCMQSGAYIEFRFQSHALLMQYNNTCQLCVVILCLITVGLACEYY